MSHCIDILLPVHSDHIYLRHSLLSASSLLSDAVKLIVVVNGPSCYYLEQLVLRALADVSSDFFLVLTTEMPGLANALNLGICRSSANYIARFDSDDICHLNFVAHHLLILSKHPDILLFCGSSSTSSISRSPALEPSPPDPSLIYLQARDFIVKNPIFHPASVFKRSVVISLGGYHEVKYAEDYDLWLRLLLQYPHSIARTSTPIIYYRSTGVSGSRGSPYAYLSMAYIQLKMLRSSRQIIWIFAILFSFAKLIVSLFNELLPSRTH